MFAAVLLSLKSQMGRRQKKERCNGRKRDAYESIVDKGNGLAGAQKIYVHPKRCPPFNATVRTAAHRFAQARVRWNDLAHGDAYNIA